MNSLTVAYITSRKEPKIEWFFSSLAKQMREGDPIKVFVIDSSCREEDRYVKIRNAFHQSGLPRYVGEEQKCPKHSIWQGRYRITKEDWWAKSNALNTAICLCETDWIAFVDDRSVLCPGWLDCIEAAMHGNYAVCGYYEKRAKMRVENGVIVDAGTLLGADTRTPGIYPFDSWYGGHGALPLEWCLQVQGFPEICDSLGSEDSMFGVLLRNNGFPVRYNSAMRIIEDRTPGEIDGALKRADKGVSPNDKSHKIVEIFRDKTTSQNSFDIRNLRYRVLAGEPFPPPSASHLDWYDGAEIKDMI